MNRLSEGQLLRRIGRNGEIGHRTGGVLAEIRILEHAQLRERCGPETDDRLDLAVASMLSLDPRFDEQFCRGEGGRYLVLLPRAVEEIAASRMQRFLDRVAEQPIEIRGNEVTLAATLGWITYTPDEAPTAIARRVRDAVESDDAAVEAATSGGRAEFLFQLLWSSTVAITVPYIVYVLVARLGPDLRIVSLPAMVLSAVVSLGSTLRLSRRAPAAAPGAGVVEVRNAATSWITKLMAIEVQSRRASSQDGAWSPWRRSRDADEPVAIGFAPTTLGGLWRDYVLQNRARRHREGTRRRSQRTGAQRIGPRVTRIGAAVSPWVSIHVVPVLLFTIWRRDVLTEVNWVTALIAAFVGLRLITRSLEVVLALRDDDPLVRSHTGWRIGYAMSALTWFGEFRNAAYRIGQMHLGASSDRH